MSDAELLAGCLAYDAAAWGELQRIVTGLATALVLPRLQLSNTVAEDVAQTTLLELLKDNMRVLRLFRGRSSLSSYLATIVLRVVDEYHRANQFEQSFDHAALHALSTHSHELEPPEPSFLRQLNAIDQQIVYLNSEGYSAHQIAEQLLQTHGVTITTTNVRKRKERAIKHIRRILNDEM